MSLTNRCSTVPRLVLLLSLFVQITLTFGNNNRKDINDIYLKNIINNMNFAVDPCEDFFNYSCGHWAQNYESNNYVDIVGFMDYKVYMQFLEILETYKDYTNNNKNSNSAIYGKLWNYYESCVKLKAPTLNPFLKLVQPELNFTWPIFRRAMNKTWTDESNFNWLNTIAILRKYDFNGIFFTQTANVRLYNSSQYVIQIQQHRNKHQFQGEDVAEIFLNFGLNEVDSLKLTEQIMTLERAIENITLKNTVTLAEEEKNWTEVAKQEMGNEEEIAKYIEKYKSSYKIFTLPELQSEVSALDWEGYLSIILDRAVNVTTDQLQIVSLNPQYFNDLQNVLSETSNETIANYIMLKFMYYLTNAVPDSAATNSIKCIENLRSYMPLAMNYIYEQNIYVKSRKRTDYILLEMFKQLQIGFKSLVKENYLKLNDTERNYILEELDTMQLKIGNIPRLLTKQFVIDYYKDLHLDSNSFHSNHLQLLRHYTHQDLKYLKNQSLPSNDMDFYHRDPETARSSSPEKLVTNVVLVPYGYLQMPFYHDDLDPLYQYSLFGFILAHEMMHAFDLSNILYDKSSNFNELGAYVMKHYESYMDCMHGGGGEGGENYTSIDDIDSENIADISGLRLVYQTYLKQILRNNNSTNYDRDDDNDLDNSHFWNKTNLTRKQLFFINSAQFLCANMEKMSDLGISSVDLEHEMHDARVRLNWASFEEFSNVFKCKNESKMNSRKRCRLW